MEKKERQDTNLFIEVEKWKWPIVYCTGYNMSIFGISSLYIFDAGKWGRIFNYLKDRNININEDTTVEPREAMEEDLLKVHTKSYLNGLNRSGQVAEILELFFLAIIPNRFIQSWILRPFRFQTGGTILAAKLAVERGWAINLGGGFHHSHAFQGGGFCVYADITLAIRMLQEDGIITTAMIVDLDAHQGNGHERDFKGDQNIFIMDIYNEDIYPDDSWAKRAIKIGTGVKSGITDNEYMPLVKGGIEEAISKFKPDLLVYNAGTDIMRGDPLGKMDITEKGIIQRDQIVFQAARQNQVPIVMVTSGGYQRITARVVADSIINLYENKLIQQPEGQPSSPDAEVKTYVDRKQLTDGTAL